jgi:AraC-like DNA-binding protein
VPAGADRGAVRPLPHIIVVGTDPCRRAVLSVLLRRYGTVTARAELDPAPGSLLGGRRGVLVLDGVGLQRAARHAGAGLAGGSAGRIAAAPPDAGRAGVGLAALFDSARGVLGRGSPDLPRVGPAVARVLEHVARACSRRLPVEDLAAVSGLSPSRFAHVFRDETGLSPARFVRRVRVELARELLASGEWPSVRVARALGLVDGSHLARVFWAETGEPLASCRPGSRRGHGAVPERGRTPLLVG